MVRATGNRGRHRRRRWLWRVRRGGRWWQRRQRKRQRRQGERKPRWRGRRRRDRDRVKGREQHQRTTCRRGPWWPRWVCRGGGGGISVPRNSRCTCENECATVRCQARGRAEIVRERDKWKFASQFDSSPWGSLGGLSAAGASHYRALPGPSTPRSSPASPSDCATTPPPPLVAAAPPGPPGNARHPRGPREAAQQALAAPSARGGWADALIAPARRPNGGPGKGAADSSPQVSCGDVTFGHTSHAGTALFLSFRALVMRKLCRAAIMR